MKKYIFITTPITSLGGSQCYVAAKAAYLESQGWNVHILSSVSLYRKCLIKSLQKYKKDSTTVVGIPPFFIGQKYVERILDYLIKKLGHSKSDDEIIIESHEDVYSFWGELLAQRMGARHYIYTMNEHYREKNQFYEEKIDFFIYKFQRGEILGNFDTLTRLFDGYLKIEKEDIIGEIIINESPVLDVECKSINKLKKYDWNIAYLGRGMKPYVSNIITEIGNFAQKHPDKKIHFITISDIDKIKTLRKQIVKILQDNSNLHYTDLGCLHPIPRVVFTKIDVMIAGSGSARHSAEEGVPTIVADPEHQQSNGILGYETMNSIMMDSDSVVTSFTDALERVLVEKTFLFLKNKIPPKMSVEESTKQNFQLFSKSSNLKDYYRKENLLIGDLKFKLIAKTYLLKLCPPILMKILLFCKHIYRNY